VIFEFGDYRLDERRVTLTGPKGPIHVEPQVFSVLQYLLNNRDRVVPKEELLDSVWGDRFVSESALSSRLKAARRAVGDDGQAQHMIRTVHGVGYHFVAAVDARSDAELAVPAMPDQSLPVLRNELVGRDEDLAGMLKTVRTARVTTITGPGGVGKTTLALAVAHRMHEGETTFVDLSSARTVDDVARTLAGAAGVEGEVSRSIERLADHFATRRTLIILDNCEQILGPVADLADRMMARGGDARILATSREPLTVAGEHVWPLAPLDTAGPVLFVERAREADPRESWDPADPAIIELCDRLDGLPLALELAAGQLRRWGFAELRRQLDGRLGALSRGAHRSGSRHGTMAAAIDWSHQLLSEPEQLLLRRLSVFPSWFDISSIDAIVRLLPDVEMPATLGDLVDKSLVVRDQATGRFRLLETIRVFAREHLDALRESDPAFECHRRHVAEGARRLPTRAVDVGPAGRDPQGHVRPGPTGVLVQPGEPARRGRRRDRHRGLLSLATGDRLHGGHELGAGAVRARTLPSGSSLGANTPSRPGPGAGRFAPDVRGRCRGRRARRRI
jgi:predicted ATPase/DNA-binding winged helix-turn-helix (wHTH) protein